MSSPHRLQRKHGTAWGLWHLTVGSHALVYDSRDSAYYEVPLRELATVEDALRVEKVVRSRAPGSPSASSTTFAVHFAL